MLRRLAILGALFLAGLIAGCGETETKLPTDTEFNPFAGARAGTDTTFEVMTWNLRTFPLDGDRTIELAAQAIAAIDPDLVALQEIQSLSSFNRLRDELAGWEGYRGITDSNDLRLAFLYKTAAVEIVPPGFTEVFVSDNRLFPRAPLVVHLRAQGRELVVIDNHLKCCGDGVVDEDDVWDEETRRREASIMLEEYIATELADRPVILLGDLNDRITDPPAANVFQIFLDAPDRYRFADAAIAVGPASDWSYPPYTHLDHILVTTPLFDALAAPDAAVLTVHLETWITGGLAQYQALLSDHRPVLMRIDLR